MSDNQNTVYFIGAGPGDPKYLTIEGSEALARCPVVYAVDPYPETFATLLEEKEIKDPFDLAFAQILTDVEAGLSGGDVAFLVPGDMTVFSPFLPIAEQFGDRTRFIAGVGTVNAAAALLKRTLVMPGISRSVVLASPKHIDGGDESGELANLAEAAGTMVLFMNNRPLTQLSTELSKGFSPDTDIAIVSRIGLKGQKIYHATLSTIAEAAGSDDIFGLESGKPSLAIVLVGDVLSATSDPSFWDRRKTQFWDGRKGKS